MKMLRSFSRRLLTLGALALATLMGGCVYGPYYPGYGYYGAPYYSGSVVAVGGGWGWHGGGWHHGYGHQWR
jgi:hypothetical protein